MPFELNIEKAHSLKTNKYASLISDIQSNNIKTDYIALEIGSRGYINPDNMKRLKNIFQITDDSDISFKQFRDSISKIAIVSSFVIYSARNDPSWDNIHTLSHSF